MKRFALKAIRVKRRVIQRRLAEVKMKRQEESFFSPERKKTSDSSGLNDCVEVRHALQLVTVEMSHVRTIDRRVLSSPLQSNLVNLQSANEKLYSM